MTRVPKNKAIDSTLRLICDPYRFISKNCKKHQADVFEDRLLFQKVLCMQGEEAAKIFYNTTYFSRAGVAPKRISKTLFGEGGVQGLDDDAHCHRKKVFMSLLTEDKIGGLTKIAQGIWEQRIQEWSLKDKVSLYHEACEILTESVCQWAGVPLEPSQVSRRARELAALFNYAGNIGPKHWWARLARKRNEAWLREIIERIRSDNYRPSEHSAAFTIANHRNPDGSLLDTNIAAVELNNILRPTVAVAVYIVHCAHALHKHPALKQHLESGDEAEVKSFVQEVRRFYPFFPFAAAKVKKSFQWQGYKIPAGYKVLLDLYGTNHDLRIWDNPNSFNSERFINVNPNPFTLIPQGGGDHYQNHRCPGEWITIEQMKVATDMLVSRCMYSVPQQDLDLNMRSLPALPKSHFIIADVRPVK